MLKRLPLLALAVWGCSSAAQTAPAPANSPAPAAPATQSPPRNAPGLGAVSAPNADPFPSTYRPFPSRTTLIRNATVMTAAGPTIQNGSVLLRDGKIVAVGANLAAPSDAVIVDGSGKYVTPGLIDTHSHLGVYPAPGTRGNDDGNEATNPVTAYVWAEHSVWPQDPQFPRNLAGGITTLQVLPGSANLIGGRSTVLKVVPSRTV